jgi:uroporphyrinogen-III synthase
MPGARPAVVVTRPKARSGRLGAALKARGLRPVYAPLIKTVAPRSWAALDRALGRWESFDGVAFASPAAVSFFFFRWRKSRGGWPRRPHVVGAVGPATAECLQGWGWKADLIPEEGTGAGLGRAFCLARGATLLLPRAEKGRPELPRLLRRAGVRLTVATAYRTVADRAGTAAFKTSLKNGADCVAFASGSAVEAARKCTSLDRLRRITAVAIGPSTAAALKKHGISSVVARRPDAESLADACKKALG